MRNTRMLGALVLGVLVAVGSTAVAQDKVIKKTTDKESGFEKQLTEVDMMHQTANQLMSAGQWAEAAAELEKAAKDAEFVGKSPGGRGEEARHGASVEGASLRTVLPPLRRFCRLNRADRSRARLWSNRAAARGAHHPPLVAGDPVARRVDDPEDYAVSHLGGLVEGARRAA